MRLPAILVALWLLAVGCGAGTAPDAQEPLSVDVTSTSTAPSTSTDAGTTVTAAPTTTGPTPPDHLLVIGDSIAAQLSFALRQRSAARGGPEVRYLLNVGPGVVEGWPEPLPDFVPEQGETAAVVSFGVWLALPPEHVADDLPDQSDEQIVTDIVDFLTPISAQARAGTELHLLAEVDDPVADARIQAANALIAAAAARVDAPVHALLPGTAAGRPTTVSLDGSRHPVRNGADATHFCPAAALVMADQILDDMGVPARRARAADLEGLLAATAGTSYFTTAGCEPEAGDTAATTSSTS